MLQRIFLIIAILAGVGVIVVSQTKLKDHINGIRGTRDTYEKNWHTQEARAKKAETTLAATAAELATTSNNLVTANANLATANADLATAKSDRDKALADLEKAKDAAKSCEQEVAQWRNLGIKPEQVKAMVAELEERKKEIAVKETENKILERKYKKAQTELDKILGGEDYVVKLPAGLTGRILVVDPKWEFVVLNIGENQGVLKDGIMMVHRDSKLVGKVKISSVTPDRSVANILPGWRLDEVHEGDQVLF